MAGKRGGVLGLLKLRWSSPRELKLGSRSGQRLQNQEYKIFEGRGKREKRHYQTKRERDRKKGKEETMKL